MSLNDIIEWYSTNSNAEVSKELITYIAQNNIIKDLTKHEIDELLLVKKNGEYVKKNDKFIIKPNRIDFIKKINVSHTSKSNKYKISFNKNNKPQLIKIN